MGLNEKRVEIYKEIGNLKLFPAGGKCDLKAVRSKQRNLWVLNGILDHGLSLDLLKPIVQKYEKIDAVPGHYMQPELFKSHQNRPSINWLTDWLTVTALKGHLTWTDWPQQNY